VQKISGPREFFLELKALLRSINVETASPQTKDALAKVCSYLNPRETEVPRLVPRISAAHWMITEAERVASCEAADLLRRIYQGHEAGYRSQEVKAACDELLAIRCVPVVEPTWSDGGAA
jgi:hypothetical protein